MTLEETVEVMEIMTAAYPAFYRGISDAEIGKIVKLWAVMFADDDFRLVLAAVQQYIATDAKQYRPPHIGAIKDALAKIQAPGEMTELEAWGYVSRAVSNGIYGSKEEFDKLPPLVQRLVGSPAQLREWAMIDLDELQTVIASNFQRSFRARAQSERDYLKLPQSVRAVIGELSGRVQLRELPKAGRQEKPPRV